MAKHQWIPENSHPDSNAVCDTCGIAWAHDIDNAKCTCDDDAVLDFLGRIEADVSIVSAMGLKDAVIRYSVAVACFGTGLGSAEDVKTASDAICDLGLRLSQHEAAVLHKCGACQLAALTGKRPLHVHI